MQLCFTVPAQANGLLLRTFLRQCYVSSELSRAVKFRGGGYFADGKPIMANMPVCEGQVISFALPPERTPGADPEPALIPRIIYEDTFAIVLEKPAGIAVHPTYNYGAGTLANGYAAMMQERGESQVFRAVNRIDKDTSGLVLAAKNSYATPLLAKWVEKKYYALAQGELPLGAGVIDAPIARQGDSIIGRCVRADGKPSRTEYEVTQHCARTGVSLAVCRPVTGRTHQIRVHFSSIGHPLAGDDLYGGARDFIPRQALHCGEMTFQTPVGNKANDVFTFGKEINFQVICAKSDLPVDFMKALCEN